MSGPPLPPTAPDVPAAVRRAFAALAGRRVNYDETEASGPGWQVLDHRQEVGQEAPGPPADAGPWTVACALVRDYDFTPPEVLRAVYDRTSPLVGRDILLLGGVGPLRIAIGVRVTSVVDDTDHRVRTWGWAYQTLEGHLQRGRVEYRVTKDLASGQVEFTSSARWQPEPALGRLLRLGWRLFGRRNQLRFYDRLGDRVRERVRARIAGTEPLGSGDLVRVPTDAPRRAVDRLTVLWAHPVRRAQGRETPTGRTDR